MFFIPTFGPQEIDFSSHLEVKKTKDGRGYGLFAKWDIPANKKLTRYGGRIQEKGAMVNKNEKAYIYDISDKNELVACELTKEELTSLNMNFAGSMINGGCGRAANCRTSVRGEEDKVVLIICSMREIRAGEELLLDYGQEYIEGHLTDKKTKRCFCLCEEHVLQQKQEVLNNLKDQFKPKQRKRRNRLNNRPGLKRPVSIPEWYKAYETQINKLSTEVEALDAKLNEPWMKPPAKKQRLSAPEQERVAKLAPDNERLCEEQARKIAMLEEENERLRKEQARKIEMVAVENIKTLLLCAEKIDAADNLSIPANAIQQPQLPGSPVAATNTAVKKQKKQKADPGARRNAIVSALNVLLSKRLVEFKLHTTHGIPLGNNTFIHSISSQEWEVVIRELNKAVLGDIQDLPMALHDNVTQFFRNHAVVPMVGPGKRKTYSWANPHNNMWMWEYKAAQKREQQLAKQYGSKNTRCVIATNDIAC